MKITTVKLNRAGFTLVEVMIVVAIIALLASIAIPNLLRTRINANESAVISTLRAYSPALLGFYANNPTTGFPASLTALAPAGEPPYITTTLTVAAPTRHGYNFAYTPGLGVPVAQYHIFASPVTPSVTGVRGFYIDEQGAISNITPAGADPGHAPAGQSTPAGYTTID